MTQESSNFDFSLKKEDRKRTQTALIVLMVGLILLISAWGLGMFRGTDGLVGTGPDVGKPAELNSKEQATLAVFMFVYGSILLGVFVFTVIALVIAARSYRRMMFKKAKKQETPVEDIWSQHKVSDDLLPDAEIEEE